MHRRRRPAGISPEAFAPYAFLSDESPVDLTPSPGPIDTSPPFLDGPTVGADADDAQSTDGAV